MRLIRLINYMVVLTILISCYMACGFNGDQRLSTNDSNQNINVNFTFIQQIIDLCKEKILPDQYTSTALYNQAVANCVFAAFSITAGSNPLCAPNADLSGFTQEQIAQILATCKALK